MSRDGSPATAFTPPNPLPEHTPNTPFAMRTTSGDCRTTFSLKKGLGSGPRTLRPIALFFRKLSKSWRDGPDPRSIGGVGIAAVQWAKHAGLTVIGTASSEKGKALVMDQGADAVFDHSADGYLDLIKRFTEGKGVDVIIEMLANVNLLRDFEVLQCSGG
jgi:hypothetical protein